MRLKKVLLLFVSLTICSFANEQITLEDLNTKERSYQKDFLIYLYLKQDKITPENSIDALGQANFVDSLLFNEYAVKINHDETLGVALCINASSKDLLNTNSDCIKAGLTLKKALTLNTLDLDFIINKLKEEYPSFSKKIQIINSPIPFSKLVSSNKDIIYDIYLNSTNEFLIDKLNYKLPIRTMQKIKDDERFEALLQKIVSNLGMNFSQSSFFEFDDIKYNHNISFLLALNRILNKKIDDRTFKYLENAFLKAKKQINKDKVLFWMYQIKKDKQYLTSLLESNDLNLYTIFAKQYFNKKFNLYDNSYENPYNKLISKFSNKRKVLLNSFMKEDSNFNTNLISKGFRIGLLQVDFNKASKMAKYKELDFKNDTLFDPIKNICFFNHFLNQIESEFYHPLFIMFAKEDGIENFKNELNNGFFQINSSFEPYLSIELYPKPKTKNYIKNIVKNYIIYFEYINKESLKLEDFFKNLNEPLNHFDF